MNIREKNNQLLNQLLSTVSQLNNQGYSEPLNFLDGNSIGKHVRHIVEFYECLLNNYNSGTINYDSRVRDLKLETSLPELQLRVTMIMEQLENTSSYPEKSMQLVTSYESDGPPVIMQTGFNRELWYNMEHCVHHMAIIKLAIKNAFPEVKMPDEFGVAYSTIKFRNMSGKINKLAS